MERTGFVFLLLLHQMCADAALEITVPSSQRALVGSDVLLSCTFRVDNPPLNPQFLAILWYFGDKELLRYDNKGESSHPRMTIDVQATKDGTASLSVNNVSLSDKGTYKCLVIYSPDRQQKEIRLDIQAAPVVKITKKTLIKNEKNVLHCSVTNFYPKDIKVTWLRNGQALGGSTLTVPQTNADGTYRVNSTVTITPTENQDNQVIACQVEHESLSRPVQDGFQVVYGVAPSVRIYSLQSQQDQERTLVCEARGFYPEPVAMNWLLNGERVEIPRKNADGSFNKELYYQIRPTADSLGTDISCEVQHETLSSPITLQRKLEGDRNKSCGSHLVSAIFLSALFTAVGFAAISWFLIHKKKHFQRFVVTPIHRSQMRNDDKKVTLYCTASNCIKDVQVTWAVTERDGNTCTISDSASREEEERDPMLGRDYTVRTDTSEAQGLHNVITILSFIPNVSKHKNMEVLCKFVCDRKPKEERFKYELNSSNPTTPEPIKLALCDSGEVLCSLKLQSFYPKDIHIGWSCGVGHYQELETFNERVTDDSYQTFSAESECRIPGNLFTDPGFKVRATWNHESLDLPEYREVSARDPEFPWRPVMGEITQPPVRHGTEAKLQCTISGYFPDPLDVKWLQREAGNKELFIVSPSEKYKFPVINVSREADKTYTCTASLIVTVSGKTEHGAEFICQVGHPSLARPMERGTGELGVTGCPVVRNITQRKKSIIMEVNNFYPQSIEITWSRTEDTSKEKYISISDSSISNVTHRNSDGSYRLISTCKPQKGKFFETDLYVKAVVQHEALRSPVEAIFLWKKGTIYLVCNGKITDPLPQADVSKDISNSTASDITRSPECDPVTTETGKEPETPLDKQEEEFTSPEKKDRKKTKQT